MRFAMMVVAVGLVMGAPIVAPTSVMNKAEAQSDTTALAEERTLQAQLVALAQAGNTAGIQQLIQIKIAQGKGAMVAKVAKAVANMGAQLAGTDPNNAAALVNAAIMIAGDPAVTAADSTVTNAVALAAGAAVSRMWDDSGATVRSTQNGTEVMSGNPATLAAMNSIVRAVNSSSNRSFRNTVYTNAPAGGKKALDSNRPGNNQQFGGTTTTTPTVRHTTRNRVSAPPRPRIPRNTVVPIIIEPNPQQAGSPT
ncbi:hypothetical protein ACFO5Q_11810 [Kordiimonas lipolytica]|uniref:Uncharacterized protein n=1 Tax=Kordiimonas lipolytica TaxID=1662421 RepID=A0ABV8UCT8_9PROT|nr:hypothetical protein [Kordiimonas lipolytica]